MYGDDAVEFEFRLAAMQPHRHVEIVAGGGGAAKEFGSPRLDAVGCQHRAHQR